MNLCETCFKKSVNEHIDLETEKKAIEIMTKGDLEGYILDTWNRFHSVTGHLGTLLLCSSVGSNIHASDGLSITSMGFKRVILDACRSMLHLIPQKNGGSGEILAISNLLF